MIRQGHHLRECAVSRVREEIMKILHRGSTQRAFQLLDRAGIMEVLFPRLHEFLHSCPENVDPDCSPVWRYLEILDQQRTEKQSVSDPLLLAMLTAPSVDALFASLAPEQDAGKVLRGYLEEMLKPLAFPRVLRSQTHLLLLALRHMLNSGRQKRRKTLRDRPLFDDALKLLEIHCRATDQYWPVLERWRRPAPRLSKRHPRGGRVSAIERTS
jgi:tRNA nucleotidyltransferase/poly(A) polymerase